MKERGGLHILDALENLNTLVDADSLEEIEVTNDALLIPHKGEREGGHEIYWVQAGPDDQTLSAIKETFLSVHVYLQTFYSKMKKGGDTKRLIEGINTIMVLVGEATKNLERFGTLFKQRISEFEEYKQLQNFYRNRVIKESFREFAKMPIPKEKARALGEVLPEQLEAEKQLQQLLEEEAVEEVAGVHILNDLEVIKRDHLYELFYLKNEAGQHFYTYALARTIKIACDFGEFAKEYFGDDPLLQIKNWEDKSLHLRALAILKNCRRLIDKFYKEALHYKEMEAVALLHNSLMALMMAANPRNLIRQFSLKGCHLYFHDFLLFLRATLKNRDYQKFLIYAPPPGQPFFQVLIDLVHALCYQLFTLPASDIEIKAALKQIIEGQKHKKVESLSQMFRVAHQALSETLKKHPNGPVFKAVDIIREDGEPIFDPLQQGNLPSKEWSLLGHELQIDCLRIACPTMQELINQATINPEFKTFVSTLTPKEHLLFINYQDRTSWKEHARSLAVEELARHAEFAHGLTVVTLAKDTDFYNQSGSYQEVDRAEVFIEHFYQHLGDEITGYYFPHDLKKELFPRFIKELLAQIHLTFFAEKEHLLFVERLDFIELAYHFISLKLLELLQPTHLFYSSKDGLDIGGVTSMGLITLLSIGQGKKWEEEDQDRLNTILFGPTLMHRERAVHPERFERLVSTIQLLEKSGDYLKDFARLYKQETLKLHPEL
jgi:hypothetical protein